MKNNTGFLAILGTGIIIALVLIFTNSNKTSTNNQSVQVTPGGQADSVADHHAASKPADDAIFNGLVGKPAPDFTLESYDGKKSTLSSLKGKNVILFFNEGLMCYPSCWNQIAAFGKDIELSNKAVVLNITVDPKNDWKQAVDKMPELAQSTVLFDSNREVSTAYGVLTLTSSMHKGQFPGHSYVIVDKEGIIRFVRDDVAMAVRNSELAVEIDKLN
ncbi:MAG: redoxin domain-containing protein [bacterium]|nr:redoxin domain-containing protein [bacterium]